jgi:hypothetical protein
MVAAQSAGVPVETLVQRIEELAVAVVVLYHPVDVAPIGTATTCVAPACLSV